MYEWAEREQTHRQNEMENEMIVDDYHDAENMNFDNKQTEK